MRELRLQPMTADEFGTWRSRLIREYAADHVRAGNWSAEQAESLAAQETDNLLPAGTETPGMLVLTEHRGEGYGRALLHAAEQRSAHHGATDIGLNVFGGNAVARNLYESSGYEITAINMRKRLAD